MMTNRQRFATINTTLNSLINSGVNILRLIDNATAERSNIIDTMESMSSVMVAMTDRILTNSKGVSRLEARVSELEAVIAQAEDAGRI